MFSSFDQIEALDGSATCRQSNFNFDTNHFVSTTLKMLSGYQVFATGQIGFFPKAQIVVPVYDKMASMMAHS